MAKRIVLKKDLLTEGTAHDDLTEQLDEAIIKLENDPSLLEPTKGGNRKRKQMGGACSAARRQQVRIALAAAIAGALYAGGAEYVTGTASGIGSDAAEVVANTMRSLYGAQCTISAGNSAISNLLCTKYSEVLEGINELLRGASGRGGLSTLVTFIGGISVTAAFSSVRGALSSVLSAVKSGASATITAFEAVVDHICAAMGPETTDRSVGPDAPEPSTQDQGQRRLDQYFTRSKGPTPPSGGRRRKTKKSKKARKSTRRRRFIHG